MTRDIPTDDRIEQMLEVERELADQYEEHRTSVETSDPEPGPDDGFADSRLNEHTGRVVEFDRRTGGDIDNLIIYFRRHDGDRDWDAVPWPDDPTDESEELVRLCEYLGVPIDRLGDLQGEYVPLEQCEDCGECARLEIPPVPALGNDIAFRFSRTYRTNKIVRYGSEAISTIIATCAWYPAWQLNRYINAFAPLSESFSTGIAIVLLLAWFLFGSIALLSVILAGVELLHRARSGIDLAQKYFFPKAE